MAVRAVMSPVSVTVQPGAQAACSVRIRNAGTVVDEYRVDVLGEAAPWARAEPPSLSLFPGAEGEIRVTFQPPRDSSIPAGSVPFAVKVMSREDRSASVVEEGTVEVAPFVELSAELLPRTSRGSRRGTHELAVDNRGNVAVPATVSAADPDGQLTFAIDPPSVSSEPGTATFVKVVARPRQRFLKGPAKTRAFVVVVQPREAPPVQVQGSMLQEALLPPWLPAALVALVVAAVALSVLWATVLRPTIRSQAREAAEAAVEGPLQSTQEALEDLADQVGATAPTIDTGGAAGATRGGAGGSAEGAAAVQTELGRPFDRRFEVSAAGGASAEQDFTVATSRALSVTDIVAQNPNGDTGRLVIRRDGDVLLSISMANFRDLDYHFVSPIVFSAGQKLVVRLECQVPGGGAPACSAAAYVTGFLKNVT
ncbi:MAG: hypothetical protein ACRD0F_01075 [Acidimicrobiales bacterium]